MNGSCSNNVIGTTPLLSATNSSNIQSQFKIAILTTRYCMVLKSSSEVNTKLHQSQFDRSFNNPRNSSAEQVLPIVVLAYSSYLLLDILCIFVEHCYFFDGQSRNWNTYVIIKLQIPISSNWFSSRNTHSRKRSYMEHSAYLI